MLDSPTRFLACVLLICSPDESHVVTEYTETVAGRIRSLMLLGR